MSPRSNKQNSPPKMNQDFPVVGIGASAGGLEAFKDFIKNIDKNSGMAYVFIQHLAPDHKSALTEILSSLTAIPVHEIRDNINLSPDHIYVMPANKTVTAVGGLLKLISREKNSKINQAIDLFFKSLAEVHQECAIAVLFSGTGYDGIEGLKAVKEKGGVTIAQAPESATFEAMPQNAINSGSVDFILKPEEIPMRLQHVKNAYKGSQAFLEENEKEVMADEVFKQILKIIRHRSGNDFTYYKQPTLRRRIARRMAITSNKNMGQYLDFLKSNDTEQDSLFNEILIPVSYFFRDSDIFDSLKDKVFPILLKNKTEQDTIRIWATGCSTGEEAYSLAICMHEYLLENGLSNKVQVFASDISAKVISTARSGLYRMEDLLKISENRLNTYFIKKNGNYQIIKDIRDMCVFAVHNFLKDPPFSKMDLVSCRNVLIYFTQDIQKKALLNFHYALNKKGVLFIGKSETTNSVENLYDTLIKNQKIYTRKGGPGIHYTSSNYRRNFLPTSRTTSDYSSMDPPETDFIKIANTIIFNRFTPAGVILDKNWDIIHFHGDTGPFIGHTEGESSLNILKMAHEDLAFELKNALLKSKEKGNVSKKGVHINSNDYVVDFDIIPIPSESDPHYMVLFQSRIISDDPGRGNETDKKRIKMLEAELVQLRKDIWRVSEEQKLAYDKLQNAHEELLSSSEELQSLNEELDTTSEELQSNNEELITVNNELKDKENQLVKARQYAESIVETIREALVILDSDLRVKKANKAFYKYFKTTEKETQDRLIFELHNSLWDRPELRTLLEKIIPSNTVIEDFEITGDFPEIGEHSLLINARKILNKKHSEDLILMAFENVTELKMAKILRESEEKFRVMANTAPFLLWISTPDTKINFFNRSWLEYTGREMEQEKEMGWTKGIFEEDREKVKDEFDKRFKAKEQISIEFRLRRQDGEYRWVFFKGVPRYNLKEEFMGYVGGATDIHEQKIFSSALEEKVEIRTSELKESQNFLESILNMTQNLIYIYDFEKGKIVFANTQIEHCTGYTPEEVVKDSRDIFTPLIHHDDLDHVNKQRQKLWKSSNEKMVNMEFRIQHRDGGWTCQLSQGLVFKRDEKGKVLQYIGVSTDVSELKTANIKLKEQNRELERNNTELASFSSIASHDLKEPLRKIQFFLKLTFENDKEVISKVSQKYLDRVMISANRMQQLIDDLISYSRTSSQKIRFTSTDLNILMEEVLDDLRENLLENQVQVSVGPMPTIPVIPSQFRQLFVNLIGNAIKYKRATPEIKITCVKADTAEIMSLHGNSDKNFYMISVSDNGIGFPSEYSEKIFEPFQRLHGKDEYSGTGIGLAICSKIMTNHNGYIIAEGKEGEGSTFKIYVPFKNKKLDGKK
ncbi:CheR family methyltransferase [Aquiflexum sp.]|uniref:CheR family methyltransferase n=1 Tax=Aquiflexum sp. TaxID=1872584 RepID=UPI0035948461